MKALQSLFDKDPICTTALLGVAVAGWSILFDRAVDQTSSTIRVPTTMTLKLAKLNQLPKGVLDQESAFWLRAVSFVPHA